MSEFSAAFQRVVARDDLDFGSARGICDQIMAGYLSDVQISALLTGLSTKGEGADEIAGFATAMRDRAIPVNPLTADLVEVAGTGGGKSTFNVSTTTGFVVAAAGCSVAKGGNRSSTSKSGSADVLEALGVVIDIEPKDVGRLIDDVGFGFMFAPIHHAAMKAAVPVRKELAIRTIFNLAGPFTSPAGVRRQLLGVGYPNSIDVMAQAALNLGTDLTVIVHSHDGLDEVSATDNTTAIEVTPEGLKTYTISPSKIGVKARSAESVDGGSPAENAQVTLNVLEGHYKSGHHATELVVANAGVAIYAAGRAASMREGVIMAREALESGRAREVLERYKIRTHELQTI